MNLYKIKYKHRDMPEDYVGCTEKWAHDQKGGKTAGEKGKGKGGKNDPVKCGHCGKPGHEKGKCWILHPELRPGQRQWGQGQDREVSTMCPVRKDEPCAQRLSICSGWRRSIQRELQFRSRSLGVPGPGFAETSAQLSVTAATGTGGGDNISGLPGLLEGEERSGSPGEGGT